MPLHVDPAQEEHVTLDSSNTILVELRGMWNEIDSELQQHQPVPPALSARQLASVGNLFLGVTNETYSRGSAPLEWEGNAAAYVSQIKPRGRVSPLPRTCNAPSLPPATTVHAQTSNMALAIPGTCPAHSAALHTQPAHSAAPPHSIYTATDRPTPPRPDPLTRRTYATTQHTSRVGIVLPEGPAKQRLFNALRPVLEGTKQSISVGTGPCFTVMPFVSSNTQASTNTSIHTHMHTPATRTAPQQRSPDCPNAPNTLLDSERHSNYTGMAATRAPPATTQENAQNAGFWSGLQASAPVAQPAAPARTAARPLAHAHQQNWQRQQRQPR